MEKDVFFFKSDQLVCRTDQQIYMGNVSPGDLYK